MFVLSPIQKPNSQSKIWTTSDQNYEVQNLKAAKLAMLIYFQICEVKLSF